jgi:lipopolysaccharide/colanic/teichoic acid biosynthesis glycosyltransferase
MRRFIDFTVAGLALILLSPVLFLCWLLVRLTSPGPAFFRQSRMGRNGNEFVLYKFRSMHVRQDGGRAGHTVLGDHRVTSVGTWMRRFKLDELPQFWNVLRGDMSLVGPRPKLAEHEALCMPYRPGLTGRATLAFRHEERMLREISRDDVDRFYELVVMPIKAALDMEYMERATMRSDLHVMVCTFARCVNCSTDARRELIRLMRRYTPEHLQLLRERRRHVALQMHAVHSPSPEFTDELVSEVDDAA